MVVEDEEEPNAKKQKLEVEEVENYPYVHNHFKKLKIWPWITKNRAAKRHLSIDN